VLSDFRLTERSMFKVQSSMFAAGIWLWDGCCSPDGAFNVGRNGFFFEFLDAEQTEEPSSQSLILRSLLLGVLSVQKFKNVENITQLLRNLEL
jgi:hypothetical protein